MLEKSLMAWEKCHSHLEIQLDAAGIYNEMLADKDCSIFLTLAGSTSAGGCMNLYADLVKNNMVDAIVATGASIIDMDFFEGFRL